MLNISQDASGQLTLYSLKQFLEKAYIILEEEFLDEFAFLGKDEAKLEISNAMQMAHENGIFIEDNVIRYCFLWFLLCPYFQDTEKFGYLNEIFKSNLSEDEKLNDAFSSIGEYK